MAPVCEVYQMGLQPYLPVWELQKRLAAQIAAGERPPTLLLLEHPHVYTFGRRSDIAHLLWDEAERLRQGIEVVWSDRGGDVTYHGPGQLVGYPLLPLGPGGLKGALPDNARLPPANYLGYLRKLEETIILALAQLGIASGQIAGLTGVWVQPDALSRCRTCRPELRRAPAKIAAIGVKVDAYGVSMHGFALNVRPDMRYWDGIVGCGLHDYPVASLEDFFENPPEMAQVSQVIIRSFGAVLGFEMVERGTMPAI